MYVRAVYVQSRREGLRLMLPANAVSDGGVGGVAARKKSKLGVSGVGGDSQAQLAGVASNHKPGIAGSRWCSEWAGWLPTELQRTRAAAAQLVQASGLIGAAGNTCSHLHFHLSQLIAASVDNALQP